MASEAERKELGDKVAALVTAKFGGDYWAAFGHYDADGTRDQARASIFEYVETFYNRVRRHSSLGYVSPVEFEWTYNQKHP